MMVDPDQGSPANWRTELTTDCLQSFTTIHYPFYTQIPFLHYSSLSLFVLPSYKRRTFPASSLSPPVHPTNIDTLSVSIKSVQCPPSYKRRYPSCIKSVLSCPPFIYMQIPFLYQSSMSHVLQSFKHRYSYCIKSVPSCPPFPYMQIPFLYQSSLFHVLQSYTSQGAKLKKGP